MVVNYVGDNSNFFEMTQIDEQLELIDLSYQVRYLQFRKSVGG